MNILTRPNLDYLRHLIGQVGRLAVSGSFSKNIVQKVDMVLTGLQRLDQFEPAPGGVASMNEVRKLIGRPQTFNKGMQTLESLVEKYPSLFPSDLEVIARAIAQRKITAVRRTWKVLTV